MQLNGTPAINIQSNAMSIDTSLEVAFQPILETNSLNLVGFEALLRVISENEMLPTQQYLHSAASSNDIEQLDRWVIEESINTFSEWAENYHQPLYLNINLSEATLARADFPGFLQYTLLQHIVYSENVNLEIDARYLANSDCLANIAVLVELGVRFTLNLAHMDESAIADKGYGFSSCKIPASWLSDNSNNQHWLDTLRAMSERGIQLIATNVETSGALQQCSDLGISSFQGYFSAKPLPKADFECWFLNQTEITES